MQLDQGMSEHMKFAEREDPEKPSRSNAPLTLGGFGVFVAGAFIATGNGGPMTWFVGLVATGLLIAGLVRR